MGTHHNDTEIPVDRGVTPEAVATILDLMYSLKCDIDDYVTQYGRDELSKIMDGTENLLWSANRAFNANSPK